MAQGTVQWGPWIISALALAQVWIIALFKRLRKALVDIHESGTIEIGYSSYGPTVGIVGTIRTLHKDAFVKNIELKVIRKKDNATHRFHWYAFRSTTLFTAEDTPTLEIASSFLLTQKDPLKYNIFFTDESFVADIRPKVANVAKAWITFKENKLQELKEKYQGQYDSLSKHPMLESQIYDEFAKSGGTTNSFTILDRACYWEEGTYGLDIIVNTTNPRESFIKSFSFDLSEEDTHQLKLNVVAINRYLCGFNAQWFFAHSEYKPC